jgi:agmatinase
MQPPVLLFSLVPIVLARDIVFPPVSGFARDAYQLPLSDNLASADIRNGGAFRGLTTFANLPYVNCLSESEDIEKYDIAFLGAPFDTVSQNDFLH